MVPADCGSRREQSMQHAQGSAAGRGYGATLSTPTVESIARARISDYARWLADSRAVPADGDYADLWRWSVELPAEFWASIWDYFDVLGTRATGPVIEGDQMPAITWFAGSTVNYAKNALPAAWT